MDQSRKRLIAKVLSRPATETDSDETGEFGLITLNDPPLISASVDIIFIHGLGGGSRRTWSYSDSIDHFWPKSWLPVDHDFQDVRIHSFGYKSDWGKRQQSVLNIHDFSQSLIGGMRNDPTIRRDKSGIILVGHSMGGCVAKEAYILARQDPSCKDLAERIHGMFFLGTPHHGSDMAKVLESMLILAWGKDKPFVTDLKPNSSALSLINDRFRYVATDLSLWTFYETLPVTVGPVSRMVVGKGAAILGYDKERIQAMHADHRHLCKFTNQNDPNYKLLRNALHSAVDEIKGFLLNTALPSLSLGTSNANVSDLPLNELCSRLRSFLKIDDSFESEHETNQELKEPGSCLWFTEKPFFTKWKLGDGPQLLWLTGRPATGKSILASHVIDQLNVPACRSYFFFKHSSTSKSTLSDCFRSLAFQMAIQDDMVMQEVIQFEDEGISWDKGNEASVWTKLFVDRIFKLSFRVPHFWVIDGLDECAHFKNLFSKRLLSKLPHKKNLRVFFTSRGIEGIERGIASLGSQVNSQSMSNADTLDDIRLFLTSRLTELDRLESDETRDNMCEKILQKSAGSFLWVRLILQEFENVWTEEAMDATLKEVPSDLNDLYSRMVESIEIDRNKIGLAKSILTWVITACRPLTTDELRCAVKLDLNQTLQNLNKAIPTICGQLVFIDQADHVHIIHETAREFLLDKGICSELAIQKKQSHTHLASVLLQYLSRGGFKTDEWNHRGAGKPKGFGKPVSSTPTDFALVDYACNFFSEHISRGSSKDDVLMNAICTFLKDQSILSWIEHIAQSHDLSNITRAALNLRGYLGRRAKYVPPTDPSTHLVDGWINDLIRVAAKFRSQLLVSPHSIHYLIPPLCPPDSIISKTFGRSSSLTVKGLPAGSWDDCLSCIDYTSGKTTAISHGDKFFAIGLSTGKLSVYDSDFLQLVFSLDHAERIKSLQFSQDDRYLASCGSKFVVVWELKSGGKMQSFPLHSVALSIAFLGNDELLVAFRSGELIKWSLETGQQRAISWKSSDDDDESQGLVPQQSPMSVAIVTTTSDVILAIGFRNHPILIWNAFERRVQGQCFVDANNGIDDMVFNPNPDIPVLVVSYNDGRLCLFDYTTTALAFTLQNQHAQTIKCSADGRSLATGGRHGIIEIFDFDCHRDGSYFLASIYRINVGYESIRGVELSSDGLRFVDIRDKQCHVWAPAALVRMDIEQGSISDATTVVRNDPELSNTSDGSANSTIKSSISGGLEKTEITSPIVACKDGHFVIAGKKDGTVAIFSTATGNEIGLLYQHTRGASVVAVSLNESGNLIISADDSGRILAGELKIPGPLVGKAQPEQRLPTTRMLLDRRLSGNVKNILISHRADRIFLTGYNVNELRELPSGKVLRRTVLTRAAHEENPPSQSSVPSDIPETVLPASKCVPEMTTSLPYSFPPFQHPTNPEWFIIVAEDLFHVFTWANFEELTPPEGLPLKRASMSSESPPSPKSNFAPPPCSFWHSSDKVTFHIGPGFIVELVRSSPSAQPRLYVWPADSFDPYQKAAPVSSTMLAKLESLGRDILLVLGFAGTSIVYLDTSLWICSTSLHPIASGKNSSVDSTQRSLSETDSRRHFFALSEWRAATGELICAMTPSQGASRQSRSRDFVFVSGHRLVAVKGGFEI